MTEKNFQKTARYEHPWTLAQALGRSKKSVTPKEKLAKDVPATAATFTCQPDTLDRAHPILIGESALPIEH